MAQVHAGDHAWKAAVPEKFEKFEDMKAFLRAFLPGDEQYEEPEVRDVVAAEELPASFDAAENWPECSCGSCWAIGSVSSFESRACIATGKDIKYSPEDTAFCSNAGNGCNGGNSAWNWWGLH